MTDLHEYFRQLGLKRALTLTKEERAKGGKAAQAKMTPEERAREGVANNLIVRPEYMIRALIGHEQHHLNVLRERYGVGL